MSILVAALSVPFISNAAHGPAGCGLGSVIFPEKEGLVWNVLAATFNGTSGNQTFGMSTGTLGCEDAKTSKVASVSFVEANMAALTNDIARGTGETLEAYLSLSGKTTVDATVLKKNYTKIFAGEPTAAVVHERIQTLL